VAGGEISAEFRGKAGTGDYLGYIAVGAAATPSWCRTETGTGCTACALGNRTSRWQVMT
jgi:hypothetical protein